MKIRFYSDKEYQQLSPAQRKELKEHRDAQGKKGFEKPSPEKRRFRKNESTNKKKKFGKKRRTNKEDFNKKIKGIISETVSHIIDNKKGNDESSPKKSAVGSVSITKGQVTRNNLLRKGSISTINMRRILYHMRHRNDEDNSNSAISISSGSVNDNTYAPTVIIMRELWRWLRK